jgi:putative ABC transport system permease protein
MKGGRSMQSILSWGTGVIAVFAVIFLFYSNSFIIRRRKKEFGLYNILGMGKKNIAIILIWETVMVFVISISAGLGLGILFSKLSELCTAKILGDTGIWGFHIETPSIINSLLVFLLTFALILLNTLRQIYFSKPIELLHSENTGEKPPKARKFLAFIGLVLLIAAYTISCTIEEPMSALFAFFIAVLMVIVATYILFTLGSVALCKILQKNKNYYYKTQHFISVSSMSYRMKRNGISLASICILSTMVLIMISSTLCLYIGKEDLLMEIYPRDYIIETYCTDEEYTKATQKAMQELLEKNHLTTQNLMCYRYLSVASSLNDTTISFTTDMSYETLRQLFFLTIDDYNQIMGQQETLDNDEIILYTTKTSYTNTTLTIDGLGTKKIKKQIDDFISNRTVTSNIYSTFYIVVPTSEDLQKICDTQKDIYGEYASSIIEYYAFDVDCEEEKQLALYNDIIVTTAELEESYDDTAKEYLVRTYNRATERSDYYALYGGLFFLGILLSIVFVSATVLIMYYKQISEGYEDVERFEILQKVGMTKKEIKRSINSQILTVFFAPLLFAGVHVGFAFPIILKMLMIFGLFNTQLLVLVTIGTFLVFAVFYALVYKITSRSYYRIVSK